MVLFCGVCYGSHTSGVMIDINILTHLSLEKMAAILADNLNCISLNENDRIQIRISVKFAPRSTIDKKPALVQVMAWHRRGAKPLPEPMLTWFTDAYKWH